MGVVVCVLDGLGCAVMVVIMGLGCSNSGGWGWHIPLAIRSKLELGCKEGGGIKSRGKGILLFPAPFSRSHAGLFQSLSSVGRQGGVGGGGLCFPLTGSSKLLAHDFHPLAVTAVVVVWVLVWVLAASGGVWDSRVLAPPPLPLTPLTLLPPTPPHHCAAPELVTSRGQDPPPDCQGKVSQPDKEQAIGGN